MSKCCRAYKANTTIVHKATIAIAYKATIAIAYKVTIALAYKATIAVAYKATIAIAYKATIAIAYKATIAIAYKATIAIAYKVTIALDYKATIAVAYKVTITLAYKVTIAVAYKVTTALTVSFIKCTTKHGASLLRCHEAWTHLLDCMAQIRRSSTHTRTRLSLAAATVQTRHWTCGEGFNKVHTLHILQLSLSIVVNQGLWSATRRCHYIVHIETALPWFS